MSHNRPLYRNFIKIVLFNYLGKKLNKKDISNEPPCSKGDIKKAHLKKRYALCWKEIMF